MGEAVLPERDEASTELSGTMLKSPQMIRWPCLKRVSFFINLDRKLICFLLGA